MYVEPPLLSKRTTAPTVARGDRQHTSRTLLEALSVLPYPLTFELLEVGDHAIRGRLWWRMSVWTRRYMHPESRELCQMLAETLREWCGCNVFFDLKEGGQLIVFY